MAIDGVDLAEPAVADDAAPDTEAEATPEADAAEGAPAGEKKSAEQTVAEANGEKPAAKAKPEPEDDPEIDLGGKKLKRSALAEQLKLAEKADEIHKGSYKKFEEAAQLRKETAAMFQALVSDPIAVMRYLHEQGQLKTAPEEIAAQLLEQHIAQRDMTPEQRAQAAQQSELQRLRGAEQTRADAAKQQEFQRQQEHFEQQLDKDLHDVFTETGLPKTVSMMARVGARLQHFAGAGQMPDTQTVRLAGQQAVEDLKTEIGSLAEKLPAETLRKLFPGLTQKLHQADVQHVLSPKAPPTSSTVGKSGQRPAVKPSGPKPFNSFREMRDSIFSQRE